MGVPGMTLDRNNPRTADARIGPRRLYPQIEA